MLTNYVIGWSIYLAAALGLMLVFWRMTRSLKRAWLKLPLRAFVSVALLTPVNIVEGEQWLAPAYLVAMYDWILGHQERALLAASLLGLAYALMLGLILFESMLRKAFHMEQAS